MMSSISWWVIIPSIFAVFSAYMFYCSRSGGLTGIAAAIYGIISAGIALLTLILGIIFL